MRYLTALIATLATLTAAWLTGTQPWAAQLAGELSAGFTTLGAAIPTPALWFIAASVLAVLLSPPRVGRAQSVVVVVREPRSGERRDDDEMMRAHGDALVSLLAGAAGDRKRITELERTAHNHGHVRAGGAR